ncbi:MAG TPA: hypothetical protein VFT57_10845 [Gemmatimonadaceae bacterium]|nr:hypothetical protein [Gemmatimonadaceae bacterium]
MSDSARPDLAAFRELEQLIRALGDEMAGWRRRAHEAEARLKATEARLARQATEQPVAASSAAPSAAAGAAAARAGQPAESGAANQLVAALQRENQDLRLRLEAARQRTRQLLDRVRFLRQQHQLGGAER